MPSPAVEFRPPRPGDAEALAANMREQDVAECRAAGFDDMAAVVRESMASSEWCVVATADGEVGAIFGVASIGTVLAPRGAPWMLGTPLVARHRRVLVRLAAPYIARMKASFPHLLNRVHARNTIAVSWLRRVGFTLYDAEPDPTTGEPFHTFEMHA